MGSTDVAVPEFVAAAEAWNDNEADADGEKGFVTDLI